MPERKENQPQQDDRKQTANPKQNPGREEENRPEPQAKPGEQQQRKPGDKQQ